MCGTAGISIIPALEHFTGDTGDGAVVTSELDD